MILTYIPFFRPYIMINITPLIVLANGVLYIVSILLEIFLQLLENTSKNSTIDDFVFLSIHKNFKILIAVYSLNLDKI